MGKKLLCCRSCAGDVTDEKLYTRINCRKSTSQIFSDNLALVTGTSFLQITSFRALAIQHLSQLEMNTNPFQSLFIYLFICLFACLFVLSQGLLASFSVSKFDAPCIHFCQVKLDKRLKSRPGILVVHVEAFFTING